MEKEILEKLKIIEDQNKEILNYIKNYEFVSKMILSKFNTLPQQSKDQPKFQQKEDFVQVIEEDNSTSRKKIPVIQRILKDGKPVHVAKVEILQNGQHVKEVKTNGQGKWTANLGLGKFEGKITRPQTPDVKEINHTFKFEVTSMDRPIELPQLELPNK